MMKFIKNLLFIFCKKKKPSKNIYGNNERYQQNSASLIEIEELGNANFHYTEFYASRTAREQGINNRPTEQRILENLLKTSDKLQHLHLFLQEKFNTSNVVITITSGYRNWQVNLLVGGSPTSRHMAGLAADIKATILGMELAPDKLARLVIQSRIQFDQLLIENNILHLGFSEHEADNRNEVKFAEKIKGNWVTRKISI